eukprot:Pgem_evm2s16687
MFRFCSRSLRQYSVKNFSSRFHYISPARVNHLKTIKSDFNQSALTSKYFYHTSRVLKNKDDEISNKKCQHCGKASMDKLTKGFYVCNQCSNIVQIDPAEQEKEDNLVKERIQYTETLSKRLYDHLDQIVVGQEKAKKTLCIAATTHYQNAFGTLKKKRTYPEQQIITIVDCRLYIVYCRLPTDVPDTGLLCDLLWSDPDQDITGWGENDRGVSFTFGPDVVQKFLAKHDFDLVCRAHQVVEDGYEFFAKRQLVTIFSAPNYCGEFDNAGAMMSVDESLMCSFHILKPTDKKSLVKK